MSKASVPFVPLLPLDEIIRRADNFLTIAQKRNPKLTKEDVRGIAQLANSIRVPIPYGILNIDIFSKSVSFSANMIHALVLRSDLIEEMTQEFIEDKENGMTSVIYAKRKGNGMEMRFDFSEADAEDAELIGKSNYQHHLRNMLLWRSLKPVEQFLFDDVISGMYSPDEMGDDQEVFDGIDDADTDQINDDDQDTDEAGPGEDEPGDQPAKRESSVFRATFEQAWADAIEADVPVDKILEEYNEEADRDPSKKLTKKDLVALTRKLHYSIESVF